MENQFLDGENNNNSFEKIPSRRDSSTHATQDTPAIAPPWDDSRQMSGHYDTNSPARKQPVLICMYSCIISANGVVIYIDIE